MSQHVMFNAVLSSHPALFIQGEWRIGNGVSFEKQDPMSQQRLWQARAADHTDVTLACHAARAAFPAWARASLEQRATVIQQFAALLEQHKQSLARTISLETSKPYWETLTEVQAMIGKVAISLQAYQTAPAIAKPQWGTACQCYVTGLMAY